MFSLLLMAFFTIGAHAQDSVGATSQDPDSLYAKALLPVGTEAPHFKALQKGKWTVLDFWATWCPDCRREIPAVKAMYQKYGTQAKFIGISMDTDKSKLENYTVANDIAWEQYSEFKKWKETKISKDYNVGWIPTMYLIDPDGKVAYSTVVTSRMEQKLDAIFNKK